MGIEIPGGPTVDDIRDRFGEIYELAQANPEEDQGIGAHAAAMQELLGVPRFRDEYEEDLRWRFEWGKTILLGSEVKHDFRAAHRRVFDKIIDVDSIYAIKDKREALVAGVVSLRELGSPEYFRMVYDPEVWIKIIEPLYVQGNRPEDFYYDRIVRNIQRTDENRQKAAVLGGTILGRIKHRVEGDRTLHKADIGCGAGLGLVQEALHEKFEGVEIVELELDKDGNVQDYQAVPFASLVLSGFLTVPESLGESYGIEAENIDEDIKTALWVASNSFNPAELSPDMPRKEKFINLWLRKPESNINFITATFGDTPEFRALSVAEKKFNMITLFTVLHQHQPKMRENMLEQAKAMLDDELGVILVQDFAIPDPRDPHKLIFLDNWGHWQYRTLLYDTQKGWQEIFRWFDGTCTKAALGEGVITLGPHEFTPKEWLKIVRDQHTPSP